MGFVHVFWLIFGRDLPGVEDGDVTDIPLLFVDCAGCELQELQLPHNASKGNNGMAFSLSVFNYLPLLHVRW